MVAEEGRLGRRKAYCVRSTGAKGRRERVEV